MNLTVALTVNTTPETDTETKPASIAVEGDPFSIEWQKCLGGSDDDGASSVWPTVDGGYIIAGYTSSTNGDVVRSHGSGDAWVVKLDLDGEIEWQRCLGGSANDLAWNVRQTTDGGYIVAGETSSTDGDVTGNHGKWDAWMVKLDPEGETEWQRFLGGSENDGAYSVWQTDEGGYVFSGYTYSCNGDVSSNHGWGDAWVVKLDPEGEIEWQRSLGGSDYDGASSIQQGGDREYIVTGYTKSTGGDVTGNHGGYDAWAVKLDPDGEIAWQRCLGGSGDDRAWGVGQMPDGGYAVAGYTESTDGDAIGNHGGDDAWVVKLDPEGAIEWQRCLGGSGMDRAYSIQSISDGEWIVAGYTYSTDGDVAGNHGGYDAWVVKLESTTLVASASVDMDLTAWVQDFDTWSVSEVQGKPYLFWFPPILPPLPQHLIQGDHTISLPAFHIRTSRA